MTLPEFNQLPYIRQQAIVYVQGRLLGSRWEGQQVVNLYYLPGRLFVELSYDVYANCITRVHAFTKVAQLAPYVECVKLPGWVPEAK